MSVEYSTLHRAVGKLITGKVSGYAVDDDTARLVHDGTMTGVTLFKDNGRDPSQLIKLIDGMRDLGGEEFLVAVDQEGGAVQRFDHIVLPMPSAMAMAAAGDEDCLRPLIDLQAKQLSWLGINCNLVPVLDINSNPRNPIIATRSFGDNLKMIETLGKLTAQICCRNRILPAGKHFPGHGDTTADSHFELVKVDRTKQQLAKRELAPFAACLSHLPAMLIGHIWLPAFDQEPLPASLSYNVSTKLLREEMGYDGFLITDDMPVMKAIVDNWGLEDAAVMAVNAGLDNLLISGSAEQISGVHTALLNAISQGTITECRLEQSLQRRSKAFDLIGRAPLAEANVREALIEQSLDEGKRLSLDVSTRSVFVARGKCAAVLRHDMSLSDWIIVAPAHPRYELDLAGAIASFTRSGKTIAQIRYVLNPSPEEVRQTADLVKGRKCIFLSYRTLLNDGQQLLAETIATYQQEDSVLVACDVPYELVALTMWHNAMATFDPSSLAMNALAKVLLGLAKPEGICPVTL